MRRFSDLWPQVHRYNHDIHHPYLKPEHMESVSDTVALVLGCEAVEKDFADTFSRLKAAIGCEVVSTAIWNTKLRMYREILK